MGTAGGNGRKRRHRQQHAPEAAPHHFRVNTKRTLRPNSGRP